jgi:hypothetical protein
VDTGMVPGNPSVAENVGRCSAAGDTADAGHYHAENTEGVASSNLYSTG